MYEGIVLHDQGKAPGYGRIVMAMKYQKGTVYLRGQKVKMWYGKYTVYLRNEEGERSVGGAMFRSAPRRARRSGKRSRCCIHSF